MRFAPLTYRSRETDQQYWHRHPTTMTPLGDTLRIVNTRSTVLLALYRFFSRKRGEALQISSDFCQVAFLHSLSDGKSPLRMETK